VYRVCYATSTDGIHWIRPDLGLVEWQGSRHNNLLNGGQHWMRRPNVIIDTRDTDPKRRFKMTYVDLIDGKEALVKAFSPDGIHWDLNADHNPLFVRNHNANLLGWDERIAQYVLYRRTWGFQQPIVRSTSTDFSNWSSPEVVLAPGPMELNKDFKGLAAFKYGDLYLALLWVFERALDVDYTGDAELVFSRDGIQWQRVTPGELYLKRGEPGSWDSAGIIPCAPVIHDNKVWIYYSGWNAPYTNEAEERQQKGWIENGQRKQTAIGLAVLRLDGFASLHASSSGTVTTRRLELPDGSLAVNADVRGELRVEILDESGRVISGYGAADCEPIRSDRVHHQVQWHANAGLGPLRGKVVRLRFVLRDADLYSFCFEPGT